MLRNLSYKLSSALSSAEVPTLKKDGSFAKATKTEQLFPTTDPAVDGDETEELFGHVKGFSTHLIVATGKTDWVRDVADEKGSIMEAVDRGSTQPSNGVRHIAYFSETTNRNLTQCLETYALRLGHARPQPLRPQLHGPPPPRLAIHRQRHARQHPRAHNILREHRPHQQCAIVVGPRILIHTNPSKPAHVHTNT
jgi:hypothetical protein